MPLQVTGILADQIDVFCQKWQIIKLAVFGSALRDDFSDQSDVDLLATFSDNADWGILDHVAMQQELREIFGRDVDLISDKSLENSSNWLRKKSILSQTKVIFLAEGNVSDAAR
jgi:uncharacterized protein